MTRMLARYSFLDVYKMLRLSKSTSKSLLLPTTSIPNLRTTSLHLVNRQISCQQYPLFYTRNAQYEN